MEDRDETTPDDIEDQRWLGLSMATVLGHSKTTTALRERVRARRHDTGIILHGPKSVGKRTLARLYARAVLCDTPDEAGEACGGCNECGSFLASRPLGYTWLDVIKHDDEKTARKLVAELNTDSLAARRVVIIANADRCTNAVFDALLKTLEEPKSPITFILLARALSNVRLAGQSRCELYCLRPLASEDARRHLIEMLSSAGRTAEKRVLDVLVAESGGRVGAMHAVLQRLATLPAMTLAQVRTSLGHDWVEDVAAFWRAALTGKPLPPEALAPPLAVGARETHRRLRAVLLQLQPFDHDEVLTTVSDHEAALVHRMLVICELTAALKSRAATLGRRPSDLWSALARLWLSTDYDDVEGLWEVDRVTRRLLVSKNTDQ